MIAWTNLLYIRLEWKNEISLKAATLQNKKTVTVVQTEIQIMLLLLSPVPPNICWTPMQVNSAACLILTSAPVNFPDMPLQMVQQFKQLKWKKKKKLPTHPLWGPADSSLPKLGAGTSSRSGSNTGGTGRSLGDGANGNTGNWTWRIKVHTVSVMERKIIFQNSKFQKG